MYNIFIPPLYAGRRGVYFLDRFMTDNTDRIMSQSFPTALFPLYWTIVSMNVLACDRVI